MIRKVLFATIFCFSGLLVLAQKSTAGESSEMADVMRANGKIYVVVAVIVTIFIGLFLYLIRLDRKITKLERENANQRI